MSLRFGALQMAGEKRKKEVSLQDGKLTKYLFLKIEPRLMEKSNDSLRHD